MKFKEFLEELTKDFKLGDGKIKYIDSRKAVKLEEAFIAAGKTVDDFPCKNIDEFTVGVKNYIRDKKKENPSSLRLDDHILSDYEKELLENFYWISEDCVILLLYKISDEKETYIRIQYDWSEINLKSLVNSLASIQKNKENKTNLYTHLKDLYERMCAALVGIGKLNYKNIVGTTVKETEERTVFSPPKFHTWLSEVLPILTVDENFKKEISPVPLSTDSTIPAYCHFDLKTLKPGPTPNFDLWSTIMTKDQKTMFLAWLYGVLDPENNSRAALWLVDEGGTGKSRFLKAFSDFISLSSPTSTGLVKSINKSFGKSGDTFGLSGVFGARLLIYGDCKNAKLIESEVVHSILGNDMQPIQFKNQDIFHTRLNAKLLVASNISPDINTSFNNELSRVIVLQFQKPTIETLRKICLLDDKGYPKYYDDGRPKIIGGKLDELLLPEMPHILFLAQKCYKRICPKRSEYIIPDSVRASMLEIVSSEEELLFMEFFNENYVYADGDRIPRTKIHKSFKDLLKSEDIRDRGGFKIKSLERFFKLKNILQKSTRIPGSTSPIKCYINVREKTEEEKADYIRNIIKETGGKIPISAVSIKDITKKKEE